MREDLSQLYTVYPGDPDNPDGIRKYFQKIIDTMPNNVFWLNRNCITMGCNKNTLKLIGLDRLEDFVGITYEEMGEMANWQEGQAESFKKDDMEVMETGIPKLNIEEPPLYDENGNPVYYMSSRVPIFDSGSNVIGVVGISVDITERKKTEEALRLAKKIAEDASNAKTEFVANMSHDIRTPLAGIIGTAELMQSKTTDVEQKDYAHDLVSASKSLLALLNEIIEIAKLDLGNLPEVNRAFNINNLITGLYSLLKPTVERKGLEILVHIDDGIPDALEGNDILLNRVLLNLLGNAIKFTEQGKVSLTVNLLFLKDKQAVLQFIITDTGPGIPESKQKIIFEAFKRLTPAYEGNYSGTGLGLYIVKKFLDALHGKIEVKSDAGKGSSFICTIPFLKTEAVPVGYDNQLSSISKDIIESEFIEKSHLSDKEYSLCLVENRVEGVRVLVVEDTLIPRKVAKSVLTNLGCYVDTVITGEASIKAVKENDYDLIFMDLGLPDIDGCQATAAIRDWEIETHRIELPIIALTAHADDKKTKQCFEVGMNEVLYKPLLKDYAQRMINKYVLNKYDENIELELELESEEKVGGVISWETLDKLYKNREIGSSMLDEFIDQLDEDAKKIDQLYNEKKWDEMVRSVHYIHGAMGYCGVLDLKSVTANLEDILKKQKMDELVEVYSSFNREVERLKKEYKIHKSKNRNN